MYQFSRFFFFFLHWRTKASHKPTSSEQTRKQSQSARLALSDAHLTTRCLSCTQSSVKELRRILPLSLSLSLSPVRSGGRILILVRQPDPRFTPRVWLVPIVHCQGLLMERQQWIPSPHKWLSDRAPSSITSYNVEVQKMRPSGGLIWCFICSFEELLSVPPFFFCYPPPLAK